MTQLKNSKKIRPAGTGLMLNILNEVKLDEVLVEIKITKNRIHDLFIS